MTCINCSTSTTEKFCPNCGQRQEVKKLSLTEGWNDFWARIYGFDGMFPRTLRDLTIRPGQASRKYIEGNRIAYYGPVGYFFLMITLLYVVASLLDVDLKEFLKNANKGNAFASPNQGVGQQKFMQSAYQLISDNLKIVSFVIVPVQAFCSRFLFFRKGGLNFIEHTVLPFYALGHLYWLSIMSLIFFSFTGAFFPAWIQMVVAISYFSYAYADLFIYQSKVKALFKGLGVYITTQLLFAMLVVVVMILIVLLNPEFFEMLKPSNNH